MVSRSEQVTAAFFLSVATRVFMTFVLVLMNLLACYLNYLSKII